MAVERLHCKPKVPLPSVPACLAAKIRPMIDAGFSVVLVDDEIDSPLKRSTHTKRYGDRELKRKELEDLYEIHGRLLNEDELKRLQGSQQSLLSLSGHIFFEIKDFLEKVYPGKVSHIGAPCEADHQLAALFHQGIIDYVYSIDSDLSVLGCDTIDNVCYNKEKKKHACWFSNYQGLVESILPKAFKVKKIERVDV